MDYIEARNSGVATRRQSLPLDYQPLKRLAKFIRRYATTIVAVGLPAVKTAG
ncbi:MAG TPA: hypothetical protein VI306_13990 [Pyrinomonadaceae bacterium]